MERARRTFHGQRGELRQRYREGQEDQLKWLTVRPIGTLVNSVANEGPALIEPPAAEPVAGQLELWIE